MTSSKPRLPRGARVFAIRALIAATLLLGLTQVAFAGVSLWAHLTHRQVIVVTGGSMEPQFSAGDAIVVAPVPEQLAVGTVVTFQTSTGLVTHRIIANKTVNGQPYVQTKGDANDSADVDLTAVADVVGVVERSVPAGGSAVLFLSSPLGRALTLVPMMLVLVISETRRTLQVWRAASAAADPGSHHAAPDRVGGAHRA